MSPVATAPRSSSPASRVSQKPRTLPGPYSSIPETTADRKRHMSTISTPSDFLSYLVEWAELVSLDLSTFSDPGGKEALAKQLKYAVHNVGCVQSYLRS